MANGLRQGAPYGVLVTFIMLWPTGLTLFWLIEIGKTLTHHDPNRCRGCGYDLRGSPSIKCPECGTANPRDFGLAILDDNQHTFEYVIKVLEELFGYDETDAACHACVIDLEGRAVIWVGTLQDIQTMIQLIESFGLDDFGETTINEPLKTSITAIPGVNARGRIQPKATFQDHPEVKKCLEEELKTKPEER